MRRLQLQAACIESTSCTGDLAMRAPSFLLFAGLIALLFGLGFLLVPISVLSPYAVTTDASGLLLARFFGASLVELGLMLILVRHLLDASAMRAISMGGAVGSLLGLAVAVTGQVTHLVNGLGWSSVAIYGLLFIGFASFAFGRGGAS
ncbi:MAG TPA: hypothetical protein VEI47_00545 [Gemmatimonadales bacterium]|nr:hypothetical protein [Gemmatimonadales bacterium]